MLVSWNTYLLEEQATGEDERHQTQEDHDRTKTDFDFTCFWFNSIKVKWFPVKNNSIKLIFKKLKKIRWFDEWLTDLTAVAHATPQVDPAEGAAGVQDPAFVDHADQRPGVQGHDGRCAQDGQHRYRPEGWSEFAYEIIQIFCHLKYILGKACYFDSNLAACLKWNSD